MLLFNKREHKDTRLVEDAKKEKEAYGKLYEKYVSKVRVYVRRRMAREEEVAEDLVQDTFVRGFRKLPDFRTKGYSYLTYLLRIAHNLLVNRYRRGKREVPLSDYLAEKSRVQEDIEEGVVRRMEAEALREEIRKLPARDQEVLLERYEKEHSIKEIAQERGKSENAVKLMLSRARKRLLQRMTPLEGESVSKSRTKAKQRGPRTKRSSQESPPASLWRDTHQKRVK